jgi:hypothetical protein
LRPFAEEVLTPANVLLNGIDLIVGESLINSTSQ